jgi:osmotically-inducible protein OsmY
MSAMTDTIQATAKTTASAASKGIASAGRTAKGIAETSFNTGRSLGESLESARARVRATGSESGGRARVAAAAGAVGAAGTFFLDPANGKRRRAMVRERISGFVRGRAATAGRAGRYARERAAGAVRSATESDRDASDLNDAALKAKVESEIFRAEDAPKDTVDVNVEYGVVILRGQVDDEDGIAALSTAAAAVDGVKGVESLLHLPGQEPPATEERAAATA